MNQNNEIITTIVWQKADVEQALDTAGIPVTEENVQAVAARGNLLQNRSVEEGWTILNDIVSLIDFDGEFDHDDFKHSTLKGEEQ